MSKCFAAVSTLAAFFLLAGCFESTADPDLKDDGGVDAGDSGGGDAGDSGGGDAGDSGGGDAGDGGDGGDLGGQTEPGRAHLLKVFMHESLTKIYLTTMEVVNDPAAGDYDLYVSHVDGPTFELGQHVQALNLGSDHGFHQIEEVPQSGYAPDGSGVENLVIGTSYRTGGSGTAGFTMSENIYALRLDHGGGDVTYAKIEVLQAKSGEVHVLAYWQPDGSTNVLTAE